MINGKAIKKKKKQQPKHSGRDLSGDEHPSNIVNKLVMFTTTKMSMKDR